MSTFYEERLSISIGAVKNLIRKIRTILEGVAKHENIYIPKNIKDLISLSAWDPIHYLFLAKKIWFITIKFEIFFADKF